MKLPVERGTDAPVAFLELLLVAITGYIGLMFYMRENFIAAIVSFCLTVAVAWLILDLSIL